MLTANTPCEGRCALHDLSPDLCFLYHDRFWTREPAEVQMLRRRKQNADAPASGFSRLLTGCRFFFYDKSLKSREITTETQIFITINCSGIFFSIHSRHYSKLNQNKLVTQRQKNSAFTFYLSSLAEFTTARESCG